jgi:hypothetical protein
MTWEAVLDRIGGLWTGVAAIVGFWVANHFELRRDARQAQRDREREWREGQRSDIAELQRALQQFSDATGHAAIMIARFKATPSLLDEKTGYSEESWYQKWESSVEDVLVLKTHIESKALIAKLDQVMDQAQALLHLAHKLIDVKNSQAAVDTFSPANDRIQALTREAQALAGQLYQDLSRPPVDSDDRSWLRKRLG